MMMYRTGAAVPKARTKNLSAKKSDFSPVETQLNPNRPKRKCWHEIKQIPSGAEEQQTVRVFTSCFY